ncbi:MAG: DnaJ domain-containing protein [Polyangiales bacterium]
MSEKPVSLPPEALDEDPEEQVLAMDASLEELDYLGVLQMPDPASDEGPSDQEVREAWRAFALAFHPDRHLDAPPEVRAAATRVFRRGAEAYRVLQDPLLRRSYVRSIGEGKKRMTIEELQQVNARSMAPSAFVRDLVKSAAAEPFAVRADELIEQGSLSQAKLQIQLALSREPQNMRLKEKLDEVDKRLATMRASRT